MSLREILLLAILMTGGVALSNLSDIAPIGLGQPALAQTSPPAASARSAPSIERALPPANSPQVPGFVVNPPAPQTGAHRTAQVQQQGQAPEPSKPLLNVDETALRYFARQGDSRRLEAEIARLKALYPNWTPPDNLLAPAPISDPELDRIWHLYADGRYAEARSAIAARRASDPDWQPPQDLLALLDMAEARARLVNASDSQQWGTVVSIAAQTPALLTCADVDVLWRLAEAFSKTNRPDRTRDAYIYILRNCNNPQERVATVQKAEMLLPDSSLNDLLAGC